MAQLAFSVGANNPFTWLPAGTVVKLVFFKATPGGVPGVDVGPVIVEDFGQLAEGEGTIPAAPELELPVYLFATGQGE